ASYADDVSLSLDAHGAIGLHDQEPTRALFEAVLNGVTTLDRVEAMLLETAVDKARGNLSSAARMLGLTRAQLAYRLKRLHEPADGGASGRSAPAKARATRDGSGRPW